MVGPSVVLSLLMLGVASSNETGGKLQHAPGHMEPLGHQRPMEGTVERVLPGVTPFQFFSRYVETATPVVLSQSIKGSVPQSRWTDKYLKLVAVCCGTSQVSYGFRVRRSDIAIATSAYCLHPPDYNLAIMK